MDAAHVRRHDPDRARHLRRAGSRSPRASSSDGAGAGATRHQRRRPRGSRSAAPTATTTTRRSPSTASRSPAASTTLEARPRGRGRRGRVDPGKRSAGEPDRARAVTNGHSLVTRQPRHAAEQRDVPAGRASPCRFSPHPCAFVVRRRDRQLRRPSRSITPTGYRQHGRGSTPDEAPRSRATRAGGGIANHPQGTITLQLLPRHRQHGRGRQARRTEPFTDGGGTRQRHAPRLRRARVDGNSSIVQSAVPFRFVPRPRTRNKRRTPAASNSPPARPRRSAHSTVDGNYSRPGVQRRRRLVCRGSRDPQPRHARPRPQQRLRQPLRRLRSSRRASGFLATVNRRRVAGSGRPGPSTTTGSPTAASTGTSARADSPDGAVFIGGAAVASLDGTSMLDHAEVSGNGGAANGANALVIPTGTKGVRARRRNRQRQASAARGSPCGSRPRPQHGLRQQRSRRRPGTPPRGGGVFTRDIFSDDPFAVTLDHSTIAKGQPRPTTATAAEALPPPRGPPGRKPLRPRR